jgi:hypothetical protein
MSADRLRRSVLADGQTLVEFKVGYARALTAAASTDP